MADGATAARVILALRGSGLTQRELADMVGLTEDKLSKSLNGKRRFSSLEIALISEATYVPVETLLGMRINTVAYREGWLDGWKHALEEVHRASKGTVSVADLIEQPDVVWGPVETGPGGTIVRRGSSTGTNTETELPARSQLAQVLWDATRAQDPADFMPTVMTDLGSCLWVADAVLAAGYQRVPVSVTDTQVEADWEYTTADFDGTPDMGHYRSWGSAPEGIAKFRRRKAGPWEPVPSSLAGGTP